MTKRASRAPETKPAAAPTGGKPPSNFALWLEEAWGGWLRNFGLLLLVGVAVVLYRWGLINEKLAGLALSLCIALGALVLALIQARSHIRTPGQRVAVALLGFAWAFCASYPIVTGIYPGQALAIQSLETEGTQASLSVPDGGKELYLAGKLKSGGGPVDAFYTITARWPGGSKTLRGELSRSVQSARVGRSGRSTSVSERNEEKHYLGATAGPVTLTLEQKDSLIEGPLVVSLHRMVVPPLVVVALSIVVFLCALVLDRWLDAKGRTGLALAVGISLFFALYYGFDQARPHRLVLPAVGAFFLAVIGGGAAGWLLTRLVRLIAPDRRRFARGRS